MRMSRGGVGRYQGPALVEGVDRCPVAAIHLYWHSLCSFQRPPGSWRRPPAAAVPVPVTKLVGEMMASVAVLAKASGADRVRCLSASVLVAVKAREAVAVWEARAYCDWSVARLDRVIEAMNSGIAENCRLE